MEIINTESLVSSLFYIGFNKVDPLLFTYVLANLDRDNFEFQDQQNTKTFDAFVTTDGLVFHPVYDISLDTEIELAKGYKLPLKRVLHSNKKLIEFLNNLDFKPLVLKKAQEYNVETIKDADPNLFSRKEIEILKELGFEKKTLVDKIKDTIKL